MSDLVYTVSELNNIVKIYLEEVEELQNFFLIGEISNINYYRSGHLYFNLKDKKASVKCVAFHYKYKQISANLKNGDSVEVFGKASLYETSGTYQVLISYIDKKKDYGELFNELENLKKEMRLEGYFDPDKKKKLPKFPKTIGVVTSEKGAAIKDIINTIKERSPNINIILYAAKVQGEGSVKEIVKGIELLNTIDKVDIIIAGRGGGVLKIYGALTQKKLPLSFFYSKKPIISAVGHEIDVLLSDFTADVRAFTPTHAGQIAVPHKENLLEKLNENRWKLNNLLYNIIYKKSQQLKNLSNSFVLKQFHMTLLNKIQEINEKDKIINSHISNLIENYKQNIINKRNVLTALNHYNILKRGYTMTKQSGKYLDSVKDIKVEKAIETVFYDGSFISKFEKE